VKFVGEKRFLPFSKEESVEAALEEMTVEEEVGA